MKINRLPLLMIAAAVICALLGGCAGARAQTRDSVSVWYIEGDALAGSLAQAVSEYNGAVEDGLLGVSLRSFSDEAALSAAFESGRPDLLLCSTAKAVDLYERGVLRDVGAALSGGAPAYPDCLSSRFDGVGRGFFPLGSSVQLLYSSASAGLSPALDAERLFTLAAACGRDERLPFLTADSFADLVYQLMLSLGSEFHADREADLRDVNYSYVYNLLADAAYDGGLVSLGYGGAELVRSGYLSCAAVRSQSLAGLDEAGYTVSLLPVFGGSRACLADTLGLAVTAREGRSVRSISAFLSWLFQGERSGALALESGLVPACTGGALLPDTALEERLMEIYSGYELVMPDYSGDFLKNRDGFEARFRAAVEFFG